MDTVQAPTREEKRDAFEKFGKGWDDFMNDRPRNPPAGWGFRERDLYFRGHAAAERFRSGAEER